MTYAHQNIELKPIPYIENPLPGKDENAEAVAAKDESEQQPAALRPKTLSRQAEAMLRELEQIMKAKKPLKNEKQVVSQTNPSQITR